MKKPSKKTLSSSRLRKPLFKNSYRPFVCEVVEIPDNYADQYPFKNGDNVLMLGEIEQMPGHVAVVTRDGLVRWGYHIENFRKLTREEA